MMLAPVLVSIRPPDKADPTTGEGWHYPQRPDRRELVANHCPFVVQLLHSHLLFVVLRTTRTEPNGEYSESEIRECRKSTTRVKEVYSMKPQNTPRPGESTSCGSREVRTDLPKELLDARLKLVYILETVGQRLHHSGRIGDRHIADILGALLGNHYYKSVAP